MDMNNKQKILSVKKKVEPISSSSSDSDCSEDDGEAVLSESEQSQTDKPTNPIRNELQNELNKMSFEDIQKLQNKLGLKKYKDVVNNEKINAEKLREFKRLNKNRPREMSSKRPVTTLRQVFSDKKVKKREVVDPRFETAYGEYEPDFFRKNYGFINDIRKNESESLKTQLKNEADTEKKQQIKSQIQRLKNQIQAYEENERKKEMRDKLKENTLKDVNDGKKPHFVNKTEMKLLELAERYKELKKSGKVDKFLAKKRKKHLGKANRHLKNNS